MSRTDYTPKPESISRWTAIDPASGPIVSRNVRYDEIVAFAREYLAENPEARYVRIKAQFYFDDTTIERGAS